MDEDMDVLLDEENDDEALIAVTNAVLAERLTTDQLTELATALPSMLKQWIEHQSGDGKRRKIDRIVEAITAIELNEEALETLAQNCERYAFDPNVPEHLDGPVSEDGIAQALFESLARLNIDQQTRMELTAPLISFIPALSRCGNPAAVMYMITTWFMNDEALTLLNAMPSIKRALDQWLEVDEQVLLGKSPSPAKMRRVHAARARALSYFGNAPLENVFLERKHMVSQVVKEIKRQRKSDGPDQ